MLLYAASVGVAFVVLVAHLSPQLSLLELAAAAVPVGSVAGAWLFFLMSVLISYLRCVRACVRV
jgi:hypothetical protein